MKLSATLFKGLVPAEKPKMATKIDNGYQPGQVLHLPEGYFRVEAKSFNSRGVRLRLASLDNSTAISRLSSELKPFSNFESKLARFIRFAFNADFDKYVKDSIREHGLPVDEDMDWSKWFEANTGTYKGVGGDELRDEAIHNLLIWALVEKDVLGKFDPSKIEEETAKGLPPEKQITNYLIARFRYRFDYIKKYMMENGTNPDEVSGEARGEGEDQIPGILDTTAGDFDTPEEAAQAVAHKEEFAKFRNAFDKFLYSKESGLQERSIKPIKILFDLILAAEDPKPRFIVDEFVKLSGASENSMKGYIKKLAEVLTKFADVAPKGLINTPLIKQIRSLAPKQSSQKESPMSLKEKLAGLKAKYQKAEAKPVNKWAKMQRIALEEPEEAISASGELALAFADLAEACDALADNLAGDDKTTESAPEAPKAEGKEEFPMAASKKASKFSGKFANFKRIAMENPGSLADALKEMYSTMDQVAEGVENLATNLGIDLGTPGMGDDLGMGGDEFGAPMGDDLGMTGVDEGSGPIGDTLPPVNDDLGSEPLPVEPVEDPLMAPENPAMTTTSALRRKAGISAQEWDYLYNERAGIKEDSHMPREQAEQQAKAEITKQYGPRPMTASRRAALEQMYPRK